MVNGIDDIWPDDQTVGAHLGDTRVVRLPGQGWVYDETGTPVLNEAGVKISDEEMFDLMAAAPATGVPTASLYLIIAALLIAVGVGLLIKLF